MSLEEPIKDQHYSQESLNEINRVSKAKLRFQEDWPTKFKWFQEDLETGILWCTYCRRDPHCKSLFGKTGAKFFKTSTLEEHARSVAHRDAILLQERDKNGLENCAIFLDVWGMIKCNDVWKEKLPELLKLSLIGLIQCSSTTWEWGFSRLNLIKNKFRNRLKTNAVDTNIYWRTLIRRTWLQC